MEGSLAAKRFMADGVVRAKSVFIGSCDESATPSPNRCGEEDDVAAGEVAASKILPKVDLREDAMSERVEDATFVLLLLCVEAAVWGEAVKRRRSQALATACRTGHNAALFRALPRAAPTPKVALEQIACNGLLRCGRSRMWPFVA